MTTAPPPKAPTFTPEQRRRLGQVYSLILRWGNEAKKNDKAETNFVSTLTQPNTPEDLAERTE